MATVKAQNTRLFQPTTISGCQLWLDGTDPAGTGSAPTNGATVSTWVDKSGNGLNGTAVNNPTYSSSAKGINFTYSSSQYYTLPNGTLPYGDTSYSYFFIVNWTGNSGPYGIVGAGILSTDQLWVIRNTTGANTVANYWYSDDITTSTTMTPGQTTCIGAFYTSGRGTRSVWINFSSGVSGNPSNNRNQPNTNCTIGAAVVSQSEYMSGTISEVIVYNTSLSTTQRQQVEGYLAYKWGIQGSLPTSHPYYSIPYFAETVYYPQAIIKTTGTNLKHPVAIAGLSLWFDALDVYGTGQSVPIGSVVTQWIDKSPFSNSTSSYNGSPIYSGNAINANPAIYFKSSNSPPPMYYLGSMSQTFSGTQMNCFAVATLGSNIGASSNSYSAYGRLLGLARTGANDYGDPSTTFPFIQNNGTQAMIIGRQSSYLSTPVPSYNTPFVIQSSQNSNMEYIGVNGNLTPASQNTGISSAFNISAYGIGTNPNTTDAGSYWTGYIGEVIAFFGVALTTPQVQAVEGYLAWKWGLQGSLASGHPYQSSPTLSPPYKNPIVRNNYTTRLNPTSIGGCQLWLDAADAITITGTSSITAWRDKSGLSYTMVNNQATCSLSFSSLNNQNTVYVPSGANLKLANFLFYTNFTTFIVGKGAGGRLLIGGLFGTNGVGFYEYTGNSDLLAVPLPSGSTFLDVYDNVGVPVSTNTWFIWCIGYDNKTNTTANPYRVNGISRTTVAGGGSSVIANSSGTGSLYLNSTNGTNSYDSDYFAEIIHYNTTLSLSQCQNVEGYLAWKWGLPKSLPTTHPYYNFPPSP